jgi:hypothetical protein
LLSLLAVVGILPLSSCARVGRVPTFAYARETEGGCYNFYFHKGTANRLEVLWILAEKEKLGLLEQGSKTFDLAATPDGLEVGVDLWESAPQVSPYCNDAGPDTRKEATWKARRGKVTITIHGPTGEGRPFQRYKASARLEGVVFEDEAGHQATLKEETIQEVEVGWLPG